MTAWWLCVLTLTLLLATPATAGRIRMSRIYIAGSGECGATTARELHYAGGTLEVHVGDCIRLPSFILDGFQLCCPGTTQCVDHTVSCTTPPQCVSSYEL